MNNIFNIFLKIYRNNINNNVKLLNEKKLVKGENEIYYYNYNNIHISLSRDQYKTYLEKYNNNNNGNLKEKITKIDKEIKSYERKNEPMELNKQQTIFINIDDNKFYKTVKEKYDNVEDKSSKYSQFLQKLLSDKNIKNEFLYYMSTFQMDISNLNDQNFDIDNFAKKSAQNPPFDKRHSVWMTIDSLNSTINESENFLKSLKEEYYELIREYEQYEQKKQKKIE